MNRRTFLRIGAAGSLSIAAAARSSAASVAVQDDVPYGQSQLGLSDDGRDGVLYVPKAYKPGAPIPCVMMLHGFAGWADNLRSTFALGEEFGVVIIAPESRGLTWGRSLPGRGVPSCRQHHRRRPVARGACRAIGRRRLCLVDGTRLRRRFQSPDDL